MYQDGHIQISSFYKFAPLRPEQVASIKENLEQLAKAQDLHGLVIVGNEGINTTLSFEKARSIEIKHQIFAAIDLGEFFTKDSFTTKHPFNDLKIKIRDEIVTLGRTSLVPASPFNRHLSPEDWNQVLKSEDVLVIDTRNSYEYDIGHFKGAVNPNIEEFTEFPKFLQDNEIPKDKKILIYCTGGIRCEKAILEMDQQGFTNVHQLEGGILNYLEKFPNDQWQGECFVFDYRVAVDQDLKPSEAYRLCPHCGQPGKEKIECIQCGVEAIACAKCLNDGQPGHQTCSKNCAHHLRMGHKSTRIHHDGLKRFR